MKESPKKVAVSELRKNLSAYLDTVERGQTITVTRRGKHIATPSAFRNIPQAIDLTELQSFIDSLGVTFNENPVVTMREEERY